MKQEEKELLLKDLCARLLYGVMCACGKHNGQLKLVCPEGDYCVLQNSPYAIETIKPYLRPMSSMTEEEEKEYAEVMVKSQDCSIENSESATTMANDWLLSKGFDVRGLILKDLALEAPEGMYKIK